MIKIFLVLLFSLTANADDILSTRTDIHNLYLLFNHSASKDQRLKAMDYLAHNMGVGSSSVDYIDRYLDRLIKLTRTHQLTPINRSQLHEFMKILFDYFKKEPNCAVHFFGILFDKRIHELEPVEVLKMILWERQDYLRWLTEEEFQDRIFILLDMAFPEEKTLDLDSITEVLNLPLKDSSISDAFFDALMDLAFIRAKYDRFLLERLANYGHKLFSHGSLSHQKIFALNYSYWLNIHRGDAYYRDHLGAMALGIINNSESRNQLSNTLIMHLLEGQRDAFLGNRVMRSERWLKALKVRLDILQLKTHSSPCFGQTIIIFSPK